MRLALLIPFIAFHALATNYYVAASGSNSNPGTISQPWQTITKVNAGSYSAGDTINFNGGDTFSGVTLSLTGLTGTSGNPILIQSYGTGQAIISVGSCASPAAASAISLVNATYVTVQNLNLQGGGWTGSGTGITICNGSGGYGVYFQSTNTSGGQLQQDNVENCTIAGFWQAIFYDATASSSTVGFNNVTVSGNNLSGNIGIGAVVQGYNAFAGGSQTQNSNITFTNNTAHNIPGDPLSGTGGIHGSVRFGATAFNIRNTSGGTISYNDVEDIAKWGGTAGTGGGLGGPTAIGTANSTNISIVHNRVARVGTWINYDGSGIDLDQWVTNSTVAYNLIYQTAGPGVQLGSFSTGCGSCPTSGNIIHDNVLWNPVLGTGYQVGLMEQGAIRNWGSTSGTIVINNTVFINGFGAMGKASCFSFEIGSFGTGNYYINNIAQTTAGVPFFWANQTNNAAHLPSPTNLIAVGNIYDSSGGSLLISNDNGAGSYTNITTLSAWKSAGYEIYSLVGYGSTAPSYLTNLANITSAFLDSLTPATMATALNAFGIGAGSSAVSEGINPSLLSITPGATDWLGNARPRSAGVWDAGAVQLLPVQSTVIKGSGKLAGESAVK